MSRRRYTIFILVREYQDTRLWPYSNLYIANLHQQPYDNNELKSGNLCLYAQVVLSWILFCWLDEISLITLIFWISFLTILLGWVSRCLAVAIQQASDLRKNQDEMVFCDAETKTRNTLQVARTICYIKTRLNTVTENSYCLVSLSAPFINNTFCFYFHTEKSHQMNYWDFIDIRWNL